MNSSDIEKLANLARLKINEETVAETTKSITEVLTLIDQLQAAETTDIAPMAHPFDAVQRLRADTVTEVNEREKFQAIAPAIENGLYLVPKVID